jgi:hypothetical protein
MYLSPTLRNERGSALVVALLMLVVLTLIGISASSTSTFELQISGNDKLYKMAFYQADGGTEAGAELIEQNIEERDWNKVDGNGDLDPTTGTLISGSDPYYRGNVGVESPNPYLNTDIGATVPSDGNRDAVIPQNPAAGEPHTNILMGGDSVLSTGSAVLLASGYEGMGKGAGGGGVWIVYNIRAQHQGVRNSTSRINQQWRHVM